MPEPAYNYRQLTTYENQALTTTKIQINTAMSNSDQCPRTANSLM